MASAKSKFFGFWLFGKSAAGLSGGKKKTAGNLINSRLSPFYLLFTILRFFLQDGQRALQLTGGPPGPCQ